jgi:hypothetical protein
MGSSHRNYVEVSNHVSRSTDLRNNTAPVHNNHRRNTSRLKNSSNRRNISHHCCAAAQASPPSCVYVIGHIEPRFPLLSVEKEF